MQYTQWVSIIDSYNKVLYFLFDPVFLLDVTSLNLKGKKKQGQKLLFLKLFRDLCTPLCTIEKHTHATCLYFCFSVNSWTDFICRNKMEDDSQSCFPSTASQNIIKCGNVILIFFKFRFFFLDKINFSHNLMFKNSLILNW